METPKGPGDNCDDCGSELVQLNFCKRRLYEKERKPGKRREASDEQEQDAGNELALKLEVNDDDSSSTSSLFCDTCSDLTEVSSSDTSSDGSGNAVECPNCPNCGSGMVLVEERASMEG